MADQETMRRLRAIRVLARQMPLKTADARLAQIGEVASGKGDVDGVFQANVQSNLAERLKAGMASVAPITGAGPETRPKKKPEDEGKKKTRLNVMGTDRGEAGGRNRSE